MKLWVCWRLEKQYLMYSWGQESSDASLLPVDSCCYDPRSKLAMDSLNASNCIWSHRGSHTFISLRNLQEPIKEAPHAYIVIVFIFSSWLFLLCPHFCFQARAKVSWLLGECEGGLVTQGMHRQNDTIWKTSFQKVKLHWQWLTRECSLPPY